MTDRLKVGVVTSVHGIKGEVKVFPTTDDSRRFKKLKQVYLDTSKEMLPLEIEGVKFFKQMVILKFKGYENPDDVMKFRQKELWIDRKDAVRLSKDEYFIADLIDMEVCDEEGKLIGTLKDVISTGANDVYAVETPEGKEVLFPAIRQCILDVDTEARKMTVHVMEGLLDL